jgi:hypothetical protein
MDMGLHGKVVISADVEYSILLRLSDGFFIRIESRLTLDFPGGTVVWSPDDRRSEPLQPFLDLTGQAIAESATDSGILTLAFTNGSRLCVKPDRDYEAWTVSGPDGMLVVCMPGGELAIWDRDEDVGN